MPLSSLRPRTLTSSKPLRGVIDTMMWMRLLMSFLLTLPLCGALSPVVVKIERASRTLAATFIYEGLIKGQEPLDLFDDDVHAEFWFERGQAAVASELSDAAVDTDWAKPKPIEQPLEPEQEFNSPLLAARAARARKTVQMPLPTLQSRAPIPEGAEPEGEPTAAKDVRSGASRALVRKKLLALRERRVRLERALDAQLDPMAAPKLPAFDIAVLLLFLCELETAELPVPVACKEAVELSVAYSGDDQESYRHVQGVLGAYAREQLGRES